MDDRPVLRDLTTGAAAAALLVILSMLGLSVWVSAPLALAAYAAAVRIRVTGRTHEAVRDRLGFHRAHRETTGNLAAIVSMIPRISNPSVRSRVSRIADQSALVLTTAQGDRDLAAVWAFNERILKPFRALLGGYLDLASRRTKSGDALLCRIETEELVRLERTIEAFYERLNRSQVTDLATLISVLEFSIEGLEAARPRRRVS